MLWRILFPLLFFLGPRIVPRIIRTVYLVWKLVSDPREPLLLKLIFPATLLYFATPVARLGFVGLAGYLVVLLLAVFMFLQLSPRHVIETHAPWMAGGGSRRRDSSQVVEGKFRVMDEEEPTD